MLSFQKLDVYQRSIEFVPLALEAAAAIPRGQSALGDQLRRAAFSVSLNIAEAAGRTSAADAAKHYAIARGSAMECAAAMDVAFAMGALSGETHARGTELLARVVAMLTRLCK